MPWQVDQDQLAVRRQQVSDGAEGLAPVAHPMQKHQRRARSDAVVREAHRALPGARTQAPLRSRSSASARIAAPSVSLRRSFTYARCVL